MVYKFDRLAQRAGGLQAQDQTDDPDFKRKEEK
jgi:hypothetical protein